MSPPDPRLDMHDLGPDRAELLARIPFDPDPLHAYAEDLVELPARPLKHRRTLQPIHVLLAGLLGVALGFLVAHATLAASRAAHQQGSPGPDTPSSIAGSVSGAQPEAPAGTILEPLVTASPATRPAVEQPPAEVLTVTPKPVVVLPPAHGAVGDASWYDWHAGEAAAGPALRTGNWRGRLVTVCASSCIQVRLTDFCGCPGGRVIDLDDTSFAALAPLSRGLVRVTVTW